MDRRLLAPLMVLLATMGAILGAGEFAPGLREPLDNAALGLVSLFTTGMCAYAGVRASPATRRAWTLLAISAGVSVSGQVASLGVENWSAAGFGVGDLAYVASSIFASAGLLSFPFGGRGSARIRAVLDATIVVGALLTIMLAFFIEDLVEEGVLFAHINDLVYPANDLLLLALVALLLSRVRGEGRQAFVYLATGIAAVAVTDLLFAYILIFGVGGSMHYFAPGWVAGYGLVGLAAWSAARTTPEFGAEPMRPAPWRLMAVYLPAVVATISVTTRTVVYDDIHPISMIVGSFTILALVVRQFVTLADLLREQRLREDAEVERGQLLHSILHDVATPLSSIRIQAEILHSRGSDASRPSTLISRNAEVIARLLGDLRDVSRIEDGQLPLLLRDEDLGALARPVVEAMTPLAFERGITIQLLDLPPLPIRGDAVRVTQVLQNIVGNAVKFSPDGGRVVIEARNVRGMAEVSVRDTGPGLTREQIGRLFRPFSRVHDTTKSSVAGSGLGLYISKSLVERHGGAIAAESAGPGHGSTFRFTVPLRDSGRRPPTPAGVPARVVP